VPSRIEPRPSAGAVLIEVLDPAVEKRSAGGSIGALVTPVAGNVPGRRARYKCGRIGRTMFPDGPAMALAPAKCFTRIVLTTGR
jgi:hypothetical protein